MTGIIQVWITQKKLKKMENTDDADFVRTVSGGNECDDVIVLE